MIPSIVCYVFHSVVRLGPTTPSYQIWIHDPISNQIDASVIVCIDCSLAPIAEDLISWCWKLFSVVLNDLEEIRFLFFIAFQTWVEFMSQCYITFGQVIGNSERLYKLLVPFMLSSVSHFHSPGSSCKNSWDMPRIVRNCLCFLSKVMKCLCVWVLKWLNSFKRLISAINFLKCRYHQAILLFSHSIFE